MRRRTALSVFPAAMMAVAAWFGSNERALAGTAAGQAQPQGVGAEILWDTYGVPHIFGRDDRALGYAFGWAQMQAHADLVLQLYGQARGRAAEYWGSEYEALDTWIRTMGLTANARRWYEAQDPAFRRYLDAFAEGMTAWANSHRGEITDSLEVVLPVTAEDVLAHGTRVLVTSFVTSPERVRVATRAWSGASGSGGESAPNTFWYEEEPALAGSNAWAIAPSRSASGHAMLVANPHLPWASFFTWFEAQLSAPGLEVYGATLVGSPVIAIGFNDNVAWTHTVNTHDGQDLYELTLTGDGYRWNGSTRAFDVRVETLAVKERNGAITRRPLTLRRSVHGPVVAERAGKAVALRVVGLDRPGAWKQWWDMGRSRNLAEFRAALGQMQIPMFTVMYADREGHIMHLFGGLTPVRASGDWAFWQGIVRGDTSATLWTGYHPLGDLPAVTDPPTGWLQNANDPPWTTTIPYAIDRSRYPAYMAPHGMAFRPQRSAELLLGDAKLSFEEVVTRKHSARMALADRLLDDLIPAARERGDETARRAADVLATWDRSAGATSDGAVLFATWWRELTRRSRQSPFATPWSDSMPLATPDGLGDPEAAVSALSAATRELTERFGSAGIAWGDVYRLRRDSVDLPASGGSGALGIFRVVEFAEPTGANRRGSALGGDSFVAVVEFSSPVRARALLGYGNFSQAGSPHRVDQLGLMSRNELRPVWRTRTEVEANLERRERM